MKNISCNLLYEIRSESQSGYVSPKNIGSVHWPEAETASSFNDIDEIPTPNLTLLKSFLRNETENSLDELTKVKFLRVLHSATFLTDEKLARTFFWHLVAELEFSHYNGISFLNLTPENLYIVNENHLAIRPSKISDESFIFTEEESDFHFQAPEVKSRSWKNRQAADIYSLGMMLLYFRTGCLPFNNSPIGTKLLNLVNDEPKNFWILYNAMTLNLHNFSEDFKQLFISMVKVDPKERATISDIRRSKWFNKPIYDSKKLARVVNNILS